MTGPIPIHTRRHTSAPWNLIYGYVTEFDFNSGAVKVGFNSSVDVMDMPSGVTAYIYSVGQ